jgi:two-component system, LytTR family, sensor kinase
MHNRGLMKYKLHHLLFWMLVLGTWYFLRYEDYALPKTAFQVTLVKVADLAVMIYLTNYLLIPYLFYKKQYLLFGLLFLGMIALSSIIKMNILGRMLNAPELYSLSGNIKARIYDNVIPHFFLVIAGAAFKLMIDYSQLQQKMAETAKERAEAELNFLKSQINPHFLFNSLNAVYFLIDKENQPARESLHKFSDMLRYQLYEVKGDMVPIEKEVAYLKDYVDMQSLRKDEQYQVTFQCSEAVKGFSIAPLLLIPFVENAFKHVSAHADKPNFIHISLDTIQSSFILKVKNSKEENGLVDPFGGIGLTNVKRRLSLLYPDKHVLKVDDTLGEYIVQLEIKTA